MKTVFVTRTQYDRLVRECWAWVQLRWAEYTKQWTIGGVHVTADEGRIENLLCQLDTLN